MHQPNQLWRIGEKASHRHRHNGGQARDQHPLDHGPQGQTSPTQYRIAAKQPAQAQIRQNRKGHPAQLRGERPRLECGKQRQQNQQPRQIQSRTKKQVAAGITPGQTVNCGLG